MHELSLAQGVIELLEQQAASQQFSKVIQVWLEIGALACVEEQALRFGLQVASANSLAQGAVFHIRHKAAQGWCLACSQPFSSLHYCLHCPHCGSGQIQLDGDDAMRVSELEVE